MERTSRRRVLPAIVPVLAGDGTQGFVDGIFRRRSSDVPKFDGLIFAVRYHAASIILPDSTQRTPPPLLPVSDTYILRVHRTPYTVNVHIIRERKRCAFRVSRFAFRITSIRYRWDMGYVWKRVMSTSNAFAKEYTNLQRSIRICKGLHGFAKGVIWRRRRRRKQEN